MGFMQGEAGPNRFFQNLAEFKKPRLAQTKILRFQSGMRTIAEWGFFTVFAPTPGHLLFFFEFHFNGGKVRSGVGPIAKWLGF